MTLSTSLRGYAFSKWRTYICLESWCPKESRFYSSQASHFCAQPAERVRQFLLCWVEFPATSLRVTYLCNWTANNSASVPLLFLDGDFLKKSGETRMGHISHQAGALCLGRSLRRRRLSTRLTCTMTQLVYVPSLPPSQVLGVLG